MAQSEPPKLRAAALPLMLFGYTTAVKSQVVDRAGISPDRREARRASRPARLRRDAETRSLSSPACPTGDSLRALRAWSEWDGKVAAGSSNFKLAVTWNQEESVLGVTTDLLKETGVPDLDRSLHFAEFAKLTPDQVQGDDEAICATVVRLSPMLNSEADPAE